MTIARLYFDKNSQLVLLWRNSMQQICANNRNVRDAQHLRGLLRRHKITSILVWQTEREWLRSNNALDIQHTVG